MYNYGHRYGRLIDNDYLNRICIKFLHIKTNHKIGFNPRILEYLQKKFNVQKDKITIVGFFNKRIKLIFFSHKTVQNRHIIK